jgi:hypothetical protein
MANEKKKLSKNAKLAAKLLRDSKLLTDLKTANDNRKLPNVKETNSPVKSNIANKMRPEKKRG